MRVERRELRVERRELKVESGWQGIVGRFFVFEGYKKIQGFVFCF